jgi:hypothetical protein
MIGDLERKHNAEIAARDSQITASLLGKRHTASVLAIIGNSLLLGLILWAAWGLGKHLYEDSGSATVFSGGGISTNAIRTYVIDDDDDRI